MGGESGGAPSGEGGAPHRRRREGEAAASPQHHRRPRQRQQRRWRRRGRRRQQRQQHRLPLVSGQCRVRRESRMQGATGHAGTGHSGHAQGASPDDVWVPRPCPAARAAAGDWLMRSKRSRHRLVSVTCCSLPTASPIQLASRRTAGVRTGLLGSCHPMSKVPGVHWSAQEIFVLKKATDLSNIIKTAVLVRKRTKVCPPSRLCAFGSYFVQDYSLLHEV